MINANLSANLPIQSTQLGHNVTQAKNSFDEWMVDVSHSDVLAQGGQENITTVSTNKVFTVTDVSNHEPAAISLLNAQAIKAYESSLSLSNERTQPDNSTEGNFESAFNISNLESKVQSSSGEVRVSKYLAWSHYSNGYMSYDSSASKVVIAESLSSFTHIYGKALVTENGITQANFSLKSLAKVQVPSSANLFGMYSSMDKLRLSEMKLPTSVEAKSSYAMQHEKYAPNALFLVPVAKGEMKISLRDFFSREDTAKSVASWLSDFSNLQHLKPRSVQLNGHVIWSREL